MSTPTLPSVSLPHIDVQHVAGKVGDRAGDFAGLAGEALSTGIDKVSDLASVAVELIEEMPDKAMALAGSVIPVLARSQRRSKRPFVILAAVVASLVLVGWVLKRRRAASQPSEPLTTAYGSPSSVSAAS